MVVVVVVVVVVVAVVLVLVLVALVLVLVLVVLALVVLVLVVVVVVVVVVESLVPGSCSGTGTKCCGSSESAGAYRLILILYRMGGSAKAWEV